MRANDLADDVYVMLWRYLARAHIGQDGAAELSVNTARLKGKDWPYPVIEFYTGRATMEAMLAAAASDNQRCEAAFYSGEWYLLHNDPAKARPALQTAADTCPTSFMELYGARAELKRLGP